ncbi:unnamed protein product [Paramecium sonneborni]|uniref:Uncharacterized protein n=1 Tax=Paramecium sonneborni TaxID=65129 RepID=A0A8S1RCT2_9CILI|nr:unnamed protein product [Paramecium sonneborni]
MKSLSVSKYNNNNSLLTPDKRLSRQTTQSTQKKDALSIQSYFSEQSNIKSEASKKEIIRLIKSTVDSIHKNNSIKELNINLIKLLAGLNSCINEQDLSLILIQLISTIKQNIHSCQINEKQVYDQEKAQLLIKLQQLEQQSKENQEKFENKLKEYKNQSKVFQLQDESKHNKLSQEKQKDRNKLIDQIKEMQQKMLTQSEKERKLIQLVKAVKSRGIDVEKIYKNLDLKSSKNSKRTSKQSESQNEQISYTESNLADISQLDYSDGMIKKNTQYLID